MRISLKLLSKYIDISDLTADQIAKCLTNAGLEVEELEDQKASLNNVVVGQLKEVKPHPDVNKLPLCQVDVGKKNLQQIICGAKNHKTSDKVAVSLPGAVLNKNFFIAKRKMRGMTSEGMLCSSSELGLSQKTESGILILSDDAPVGELLAHFLNYNDVFLEVNVTPNRADCLSHFGIAREMSAILARDLKKQKQPSKIQPLSKSQQIILKSSVKDKALIYFAAKIENVKIIPSPKSLQKTLNSLDIKPINLIVDVTNFILKTYGHPLHAFDENKIKNDKGVIDLNVDFAEKNEKMTSFDGSQLELSDEDIVIRSKGEVAALAGVVGSLHQGVSETTTSIVLEAACFCAASVRKTSRRINVLTESAHRFSKGVDPEGVQAALEQAIDLITEHTGQLKDVVKICAVNKPQTISISITLEEISQALGYEFLEKEFINFMKNLNCKVEKKRNIFVVNPPSYRSDLKQGVDIIEECARLNGYDKIPEVYPSSTQFPTNESSLYTHEKRLKVALVKAGFCEAFNYVFESTEDNKNFNFLHKGKPFILKNALNKNHSELRQQLAKGLLKCALYNQNRSPAAGNLFELGTIFAPEREKSHLGAICWGHDEQLWDFNHIPKSVLKLKAALYQVLSNYPSFQFKASKENDLPAFLHPYQSLWVFFRGEKIGYVGTLNPIYSKKMKFSSQPALAEICMDLIYKLKPSEMRTSIKPLSQYPSVIRDLAFVFPKELKVMQVEQILKKEAQPFLRKLDVLDVYKGAPLADSERCVQFRLLLENEKQTFSDKDLSDLQDLLIQKVTSQTKAVLR